MITINIEQLRKGVKPESKLQAFVSIIANDTHELLNEVSDELYEENNKHMASQFKMKASNILSIYGSCQSYEKEAVVILKKVKELRKWVNQFSLGKRFYINSELDSILRLASKRSGLNA